MGTTFRELNDFRSLGINVIKNLEPVLSKTSTNKSIVNQITKERNLSSDRKNFELNRNFNTFRLVQPHMLKILKM